MNNLFALRNDAGQLYVNEGYTAPMYFESKKDAKIKRFELNKKDGDGNEVFKWVVTRGFDHRLGLMKSGYTAPGGGKKKSKEQNV